MPHLQYLLAGGKSGDAKYASLKAQHDGGDRSTSGGGTATAPRIRSVDSFADLKSVLPGYEGLRLTDILTRISKMGVSITPTFYKEIQTGMLELERASGVPVSRIANQRRGISVVQKKVVESGVSAGGAAAATSTSAATQFASARALDEAQARRLDEQSAYDRERLALDKQQEENRRREGLLDIGARLQSAATALQQRSNEMLAGLVGVSPLRAAAAQSGALPRGQEPADVLRGQLSQISQAQLPTFSATATIPQLEQGIGQLQQFPTALPTPGGFTGMAAGGVIEMARGGDGAYAMAPPVEAGGMHQMPDGSMMAGSEMQGGMGGQPNVQMGSRKQAYLVGEGAMQVEPGTEVAILDPLTGTTEIIPLGGGAASGGLFDPNSSLFAPVKPGTYDTSIGQALAPAYSSLGFTDIPRMSGFDISGAGTLDQLGRLGVKPKLVRNPQDGSIYYLDPLTNKLRGISSLADFHKFEFNMGDVVNLPPSDLARYGAQGPNLTAAPPVIGPKTSRFPLMSAPIKLPGTEYLLSAPRTIAASIQNQPFGVQRAIVEALTLSGLYSPESIRDELRFFTPRGTATVGGAARFG